MSPSIDVVGNVIEDDGGHEVAIFLDRCSHRGLPGWHWARIAYGVGREILKKYLEEVDPTDLDPSQFSAGILDEPAEKRAQIDHPDHPRFRLLALRSFFKNT